MRIKALIRLAVATSVVLLCVGFAAYSYFRLDAVENRQEFNLYALVPDDAVAVVQTNHMDRLVEEINELPCSKDDHFLYVSDLFVYLKNYLNALTDATPHGLSSEMRRMLISFHEPDGPRNQVLYCCLGEGDNELIDRFLHQYSSTEFAPKTFPYQGREIRIYPLQDGNFLCAYFTSRYMVLSFQKRLLEQVIDVERKERSPLSLGNGLSSNRIYADENVVATVYTRTLGVKMGSSHEARSRHTPLDGWMEFDIRFNEDVIYCSGVSHEVDSTLTFVNALRQQEPIEGHVGACLPASTFFYDSWAFSNRAALLGGAASKAYVSPELAETFEATDTALMDLLDETAADRIITCFFQNADTSQVAPHVVVIFPLVDEAAARTRLKLLQAKDTRVKAEGVIPLKHNTLLARITGIIGDEMSAYAYFYNGNLLISPDAESPLAYASQLATDETLEKRNPFYAHGVASLSPTYNFVLITDLEQMFARPDDYVRLLPNFFFRHANFFRHFVFAIQFSFSDGVVYPNIVLLYKGA